MSPTAAEVIIVSGLPRSGTSLMMQMLSNAGVEVVTDSIRAADVDNPRGYFELEQVKKIKQDASWLPAMRGKAFKMVSQLLYELPATERYRIIFMERNLDEMIRSQDKMLARLNRPAAPSDDIKRSFVGHLTRLRDWLARQSNMEVLYVSFNDLLERPESESTRVSQFLGGKPNVEELARTVDPSLYRNRNLPGDPGSGAGGGTG
jgi:hypothetical protein